MGDLLQPWHILLIFAVIAVVIVVRKTQASKKASGISNLQGAVPGQLGQGPSDDPTLPELKYCSECGQQIKRRAEICPLCGCRQAGM